MARRLNTEEIQQILERYRASGLTQAEYCRQNGIVLSTLGRHLRRSRSPERQLVRVKVVAPPEPETGFLLVLGNGRRIASNWGFEEAGMARLIRVAENA